MVFFPCLCEEERDDEASYSVIKEAGIMLSNPAFFFLTAEMTNALTLTSPVVTGGFRLQCPLGGT